MKAIEEKMVQAVNNNKDFELSNTRVICNNNGVFVKLYNTIIFAKVRGREYYSDGGWSTVTTSSRLRALGADYSTNSAKNNCKLRSRRQMLNLYYDGRLS